MNDLDRNPLRKVALTVGGVVAGLGGILGTTVQLGFLTQTQSDAVVVAGAQLEPTILVVGGIVTIVTGIVTGLTSAFATAKVGERSVTPLVDPRANDGVALTPDAPATRSLGEDYHLGEGA